MKPGPVVISTCLGALLVAGCGPEERPGFSWVVVSSETVAGQIRSRLECVRGDDLSRTVLTPGLARTWDPDVSFDGKRVVFAGQRRLGGSEGIHVVDPRTGDLRVVHEASGRLSSPRWGPKGTILFLVDDTRLTPRPRAGILHTLAAHRGARAERITFHARRDLAPIVASDGRVVVGVEGSDGLTAVNWDGTEVDPYTEAHGIESARVRLEPVAWISGERPIGGFDLVARSQEGPDLYRIPARNRFHRLQPMVANLPSLDRIPLVARPEPFFQPSLTEPRRPADGHATGEPPGRARGGLGGPDERSEGPPMFRDPARLARPAGELFCLDARPPRGPRDGLKVRVHVFEPSGPLSIEGKEHLAGELALKPDGSFYAIVPADRGLRFELVAQDGRVVSRMERHAWIRAGEKRGCTGCHARTGSAPSNHIPLALEADPVRMVP